GQPQKRLIYTPDRGSGKEVKKKEKFLRGGLNLSRISWDGVLQRPDQLWRGRVDNLVPRRIHVRQQGDNQLQMPYGRADLPACGGSRQQLVQHGLEFAADAGLGQLEVAQ